MKRFRIVVLFFLLQGCLAGSSPSGSGLSPAALPSAPSGMAGPGSGDGSLFVGEKSGEAGTVPGVPLGDPTSGNETPMTIVGSPLGSSVKPRPCDGVGFRLCFHDVTVKVVGDGEAAGVLSYELTGIVATQTAVGAEPEGLLRQDVILTDLLFPENEAVTSSTKSDATFRASASSSPGRGLRLMSKFCHHVTTLDVTLPEEEDGPLTIDACSSPGPTDTYTPPNQRNPLDALPLDRDGMIKSR